MEQSKIIDTLETYPGTVGDVSEEDHGDPGGRMRDGESEEAAIA